MPAQLGLELTDLADRRPQPGGDRRSSPLCRRSGAALPTAQAERAGQLGDQRIELVLGPLGAVWIVGVASVLDDLLQLSDAVLVGTPRLLIDQRPRTTDVGSTGQFEAVHLFVSRMFAWNGCPV